VDNNINISRELVPYFYEKTEIKSNDSIEIITRNESLLDGAKALQSKVVDAT